MGMIGQKAPRRSGVTFWGKGGEDLSPMIQGGAGFDLNKKDQGFAAGHNINFLRRITIPMGQNLITLLLQALQTPFFGPSARCIPCAFHDV
jgi:hypothetical protein